MEEKHNLDPNRPKMDLANVQKDNYEYLATSIERIKEVCDNPQIGHTTKMSLIKKISEKTLWYFSLNEAYWLESPKSD